MTVFSKQLKKIELCYCDIHVYAQLLFVLFGVTVTPAKF